MRQMHSAEAAISMHRHMEAGKSPSLPSCNLEDRQHAVCLVFLCNVCQMTDDIQILCFGLIIQWQKSVTMQKLAQCTDIAAVVFNSKSG